MPAPKINTVDNKPAMTTTTTMMVKIIAILLIGFLFALRIGPLSGFTALEPTAIPHLVQYFVPSTSSVPHFEQNGNL